MVKKKAIKKKTTKKKVVKKKMPKKKINRKHAGATKEEIAEKTPVLFTKKEKPVIIEKLLNNKNAEKWSEEIVTQLMIDLWEWMKPDYDKVNTKSGNEITIDNNAANIHYNEFLLSRNMVRETLHDLEKKYGFVSDTIKKCRQLKEERLRKYAELGKLNPTMCIFDLKNNHGYKDKIEHSGDKDSPLFPEPKIDWGT